VIVPGAGHAAALLAHAIDGARALRAATKPT
jgi:hypothetical protein